MLIYGRGRLTLARNGALSRVPLNALPGIARVISSVSNFLVPFVAARWLASSALGTVVLVYGSIQIVSQVARVAIGDAFLLTQRHGETDVVNSFAWYGGIAFTLAFGGSWTVLSLVEAESSASAFAISVGAGCVVAIEILKLSILSDGRKSRLVSIDLRWLAFQLLFLVALVGRGSITPASLILSWGAAAVLASWRDLPSLVPTRKRLRGRPAFPAIGRHLLIDGLLAAASPYFVLAYLAARSGTGEVGIYRGATLAFLPIQLAFGALSVSLISSSATHAFQRSRNLGFAMLALLTGVIAVTVSRAPTELGSQIFGEAWAPARTHVWLAALSFLLWLFMQSATLTKKVSLEMDRVVVARLAFALVLVVGALITGTSSAEEALWLYATAHTGSGLAALVPVRKRSLSMLNKPGQSA